MASILAPQAFLRHRLSLCSSRLPVARRSVHKSRQTHCDVPGYHRIRFRQLDRKKICLWNGEERLGVMRMSRVLREFLGPGKTLSWRPEAEAVMQSGSKSYKAVDGKSTQSIKADKEVRHYEIMSIAESGVEPDSELSGRSLEDGKCQVFFQSDLGLASTPPQTELADAYRLCGDPDNGARYPVMFHIHPPQEPNSPYHIKWAIKNRMDFHPNVIKRAMPEGVQVTTKPHMRKDGKEVLWCLAAKHYDPEPQSDENEKQNDLERVSESATPRTADNNRKQDHFRKVSGGPTGLVRSRVTEKREAAFEGAMPKVRRLIERNLGSSCLTGGRA